MDDESQRLHADINALYVTGSDKTPVLAALADYLQRKRGAKQADFSGADFVGAVFDEIDFSFANLSGCIFRGCTFYHCRFESCNCENAQFVPFHDRPTTIVQPYTVRANFRNVRFECEITSTEFINVELAGANFGGSTIRDCKFKGTALARSNFVSVNWNETVHFETLSDIRGAVFDQYALASLGKDSGLTVANLMDIQIIDDAAKLRNDFGGIWAIGHAVGLILFVYPYAKFLFLQSLNARFNPPDGDSISLLSALSRFIVSGGQNWKSGWMVDYASLAVFVIYLTYNVARGTLLWKTKRLETEQEVSGLPVRFSLSDAPWRQCYMLVNFLFWIALPAVAYNTWHFLMQRVPIN